jgi:xanthine dehydrogenase accessory factor
MSWTELDPILALYGAGPGPYCLATLVRVTGSSYRQPGARMLVNDSGQAAGSLSPGCIEEEVASRGVMVIRTGRSERIFFDLRSLFGCDGHILVVLERVVKPSAFFQCLQECRRERKPLLTVMQGLDGPAAGLHTDVSSAPISMETGCFTQQLLPPIRLVLVGDRPDLQPLVRLARFLHWEVIVVTDPASLPTGDPQAGCVVMSHRVGADFVALKAALEDTCASDRAYGYLALVGGKQRRERLFHELLDAGVEPAQLRRVHCPAGLDIGAETPEEIALAIVAEAQSVLAGRAGGFLKHRSSAIHLPEVHRSCRGWN